MEGRANDREKRLVDRWYESLSENDDPLIFSGEDRKILRDRYWNSLQPQLRPRTGRSRRLWPQVMGIAASVAILSLVAFLYFHQKTEPVPAISTHITWTKVVNSEGWNRTITLPDSSEVTLFPGTQLTYGTGFNQVDRKVHLTGKASFDISRNEQKPFYVYADEIVTKVLGTSFIVEAYPDGQRITVSVTSGKVSVYTKTEDAIAEDFILTPNQEAVYTRADQKVARKLVEEPQVILSQEEVDEIRFDRASLSEIFHALEKMYGVEIQFDEALFSECTITTSIDGTDLYKRIEVICEITGAQYETQGTRIIVTGTGCN